MKEIFLTKRHRNENFLGTFLTEENYDVLLSEDCDVYKPASNMFDDPRDEKFVLLKFRKGVFSEDIQNVAYKGLKSGATASYNRGMATGAGTNVDPGNQGGRKTFDWVTDYNMAVLNHFMQPATNKIFGSNDDITLNDIRKKFEGNTMTASSKKGSIWLIDRIRNDNFDFEKWADETEKLPKIDQIEEVRSIMEMYVSSTSYAATVFSGVAGYYDRYPRIPYCRETAYTANNKEKFESAIPFVEQISNWFAELLPKRHGAQKAAIDRLDESYKIGNSVYTTLTLNKNFRTAAHRDAGDLAEGFGNLVALSNGIGWKGGYLCFPEYRVAVDIRPGDILMMDVHEIHGNTPISPVKEGDKIERISIVAYFRENMFGCSAKKIEDLRQNFVLFSKENTSNPYYRKDFNGVFPGMWEDQSWIEYLLKNGEDEVAAQEKKRIYGGKETISMINFFE